MSNDDRRPPCLELRCKEMFYKDISATPTEHERAMSAAFGKWDTRSYWCGCTQDSRGPDQKPVNQEACSRAGRPCYKALEHLA